MLHVCLVETRNLPGGSLADPCLPPSGADTLLLKCSLPLHCASTPAATEPHPAFSSKLLNPLKMNSRVPSRCRATWHSKIFVKKGVRSNVQALAGRIKKVLNV